jgi:hypothetical protein
VNFNGGRLPGRRNVPRLIAPTHDDAALMILRRKLTLRSRNHLDQNYNLPLHHLIFDGGVGAQQSEAENAVEHEQALDGWFLAVTIVEKRYVDAEHLSDLLEQRRADPVDALFVFFHLLKGFERCLFPGDADGFVAPSPCPRPPQIVD